MGGAMDLVDAPRLSSCCHDGAHRQRQAKGIEQVHIAVDRKERCEEDHH